MQIELTGPKALQSKKVFEAGQIRKIDQMDLEYPSSEIKLLQISKSDIILVYELADSWIFDR